MYWTAICSHSEKSYHCNMTTSILKTSSVEEIPHLVFYDDKCPLCLTEINHYRKLEKCYPIEWIGIYQDHETIAEFGFDQQQLLQRLHVVRGDGVVVTGASAFATIWSSVKRYRIIGNMVYKFKLIPALNFIYDYFAKWRYQRRTCQV